MIYRNRVWLEEMYWGRGLSTTQVACLAGVHQSTIWDWMKKHDIPRRSVGGARCGAKHPNWQGGRRKYGEYIAIWKPGHPYTNAYGYVYEHRLVMEEYLGRHLGPQEVVHHINGKCADNRIENLRLFASNAEHLIFHAEMAETEGERGGRLRDMVAEGRRE